MPASPVPECPASPTNRPAPSSTGPAGSATGSSAGAPRPSPRTRRGPVRQHQVRRPRGRGSPIPRPRRVAWRSRSRCDRRAGLRGSALQRLARLGSWTGGSEGCASLPCRDQPARSHESSSWGGYRVRNTRRWRCPGEPVAGVSGRFRTAGEDGARLIATTSDVVSWWCGRSTPARTRKSQRRSEAWLCDPAGHREVRPDPPRPRQPVRRDRIPGA
jgi:hypothetical protein